MWLFRPARAQTEHLQQTRLHEPKDITDADPAVDHLPWFVASNQTTEHAVAFV